MEKKKFTFKEHYVTEKQQKYVVVYAGRFQPFHIGHFQTYQNLVQKFGKDNVFIATSNKVDPPESPFNFEEKKEIITTMFPIEPDKVVHVRRPYAPEEILSQFDKDTAFIAALGNKDSDRLTKGKYFDVYKDGKDMEGYEDKGYIFVTPENDKYYKDRKVTGTLVRNVFNVGNKQEKRDLFDTIYPDFNEDVFYLIVRKLGG